MDDFLYRELEGKYNISGNKERADYFYGLENEEKYKKCCGKNKTVVMVWQMKMVNGLCVGLVGMSLIGFVPQRN